MKRNFTYLPKAGVQQTYGSDPLWQVNYIYDDVDQLVGKSATGGTANTNYSHAFSYDAMGNRLKSDTVKSGQSSTTRHSVNALNQVTSVSSNTNDRFR